ncbi:MAG TPA: hypothetical protein VGF59_31565 [Bryobacteraceae bacterium]|jgi:hypothetical protein
MAIGKTAAGLILAGAIAAQAAQFTVRHEHLRKGCQGTMTVDASGIAFEGPKGHAFRWVYEEIQELQLSPRSVHILSYRDSKLKLGRDRAWEFTGEIPAGELYALWRDKLDQRLIAELAAAPGAPLWSIPVKHLRSLAGSEGKLTVSDDAIVYESPKDSRTWRYQDIQNISSSGPFDLTITTFERPGKEFNFQLKQPITESRYNQLWLQIEKKNGRIQ